jgi:hypothetical protein
MAIVGELDQLGLVELTDELAGKLWGVLCSQNCEALKLIDVRKKAFTLVFCNVSAFVF